MKGMIMNKLEMQINRFFKSRFKRGNFTNLIYEAMYIESNAFIAHFDKDGFFRARFESPEGFRQTIETMAKFKRDNDARIVLGAAARQYLMERDAQ